MRIIFCSQSLYFDRSLKEAPFFKKKLKNTAKTAGFHETSPIYSSAILFKDFSFPQKSRKKTPQCAAFRQNGMSRFN